MLLGIHVALALGLTILVGIQCSVLGSLRRECTATTTVQRRGLSDQTALLAIPPVNVLVVVTGGMLLGSGARGGPWVSAGVLSAIVVAASAGWALRLRRRSRSETWKAPTGAIAVVQWGAPAFTLAAAFLMAARPESVVGAVIPVIVAVTVTGAAVGWTASQTRSRVHAG